MTITITHTKVSGAAAPDDTSKVGGPDWDASHLVTGLVAGDVSGLAPIATSGSAADLSTGAIPVARMPAHTGDVTTSAGAVATTIAANVVTNAKLATMPASTIKGNNTGVTAAALDLSIAQTKTLLAIATGDVSGLATVATTGSAGDLSTGTLLAARMPAHTGDVTTSVGAIATTIVANAVTNAKLATMPTLTLKGNNTGGTAAVLDLTVAQILVMLGIPNAFDLGDGSDGSCVLDGTNTFPWATKSGSTYTMTRAFFVSDITVNGGVVLKPDGWSGRCRGTFTNNGDISVIGNAASGTTPGAAGWTGASRELPPGAVGGTPPAGAGGGSTVAPQIFSTTSVNGGAGGFGGGSPTAGGVGLTGGVGHGGSGGGGGGTTGGGNGADGGSGGTVTSVENGGAGRGDTRQFQPAMTGRTYTGVQFTSGSGGGSGSNASGGSGAAAGGGGGGWMAFAANVFAGSGTWTISGGAGGAASGTGAGGGAGGAGGFAVFRAFTGIYPTAIKAGGLGGAGSAGGGGITAGGNGGVGGVGYQVNL